MKFVYLSTVKLQSKVQKVADNRQLTLVVRLAAQERGNQHLKGDNPHLRPGATRDGAGGVLRDDAIFNSNVRNSYG